MNTNNIKTSTLVRVLLGVAATLSMFVVFTFIFAHEGEDHGAKITTKNAALGDTISVSKQAQFLLGILTDVAKTRTINPRLNILGKVVPQTLG
ncbi:MAG: hypothetical protein AAB344_00525, partial [Bacteroidota bacterium]